MYNTETIRINTEKEIKRIRRALSLMEKFKLGVDDILEQKEDLEIEEDFLDLVKSFK